ncbi:hypothetical protein BDN72DRAFT_958752 [Pluteus cervinus]|uniref:Uncharacterized protein n=1 Tax=Pluteus cervinus TaxID=181527 RepID=A0ACD3AXS6_9AGAR|nr:hypothetical protein BDN72DRAFT_958752 [Pluteus cervinus]
MHPRISWLPIETLEEIFHHIPIPDYLVYPGCHPGRNSLWCQNLRTKKGILLVCKEWNCIALPLLYRNITINNIGALVRLSNTIEDNPRRIGSLVQSLILICAVPQSSVDLMSLSLKPIFSSCPNLRRIAYEHEVVHEWFPMSTVPIIPGYVEQLSLGQCCNINDRNFISKLGSSITSLTLSTGAINFRVDRTISLPSVHTLILDIDPMIIQPRLSAFCQHVSLPCLRNLELNCSRVQEFSQPCATLCKRHGQNIKRLRIGTYGKPCDYNPAMNTGFRKPLIEACPSLLELSTSFSTGPLSQTTVTHLNIVYRPPVDEAPVFPLELPMKWEFPSVQYIRVISLDLIRLPGLQDGLPWTIDKDHVLLYDLCLCRIKVGQKDALLVHPKVEHDLAQIEHRRRGRSGGGGIIDKNLPTDGTATADGATLAVELEDLGDCDSSSDFTWSPGSSDESESDSEEDADIREDAYEESRGEFDWNLDRQGMLKVFHEISERGSG